MTTDSRLPNFRTLTPAQRLQHIANAVSLTSDEIALANTRDKVLIELGDGCRDIEVHVFEDTPRGAMVVMHLIVDVRDAIGANTVHTMAESLAPLVENITGGSVLLRILSNLADLRLARARLRLTPEALTTPEHNGADIIDGVLDAYTLAAIDRYRAATHNKGIMNGIDPIIVATSNDWRAVEAGTHVYACRSGRSTSRRRCLDCAIDCAALDYSPPQG